MEKNPNYVKKLLAEDLTTFVHGEEDLKKAQEITRILFGKGTLEELAAIPANEIEDAFSGVPVFRISREELSAGIGIMDLLAGTTDICPSKSEARRRIKGNAISVNKVKLSNPDEVINTSNLLSDKLILIQNGKSNNHLITLA